MKFATAVLVLSMLAVGTFTSAAASVITAAHFNSGGAAYTGPAGTFGADQPKTASDPGFVGGLSRAFNVGHWSATPDPDLLSTMRQGGRFRYVVPDLAAGEYLLTFHFTEPLNIGVGDRVLDVSANGTEVITDLDIFADSGRWGQTIRTTSYTVTSNRLVVEFNRDTTRAAIVSAVSIEFVSPPCISLSATALDHGPVQVLPTTGPYNVIVGASSYRTFEITNDSSATTTITDLATGHTDFQVMEPWVVPFDIAAAESRLVTMRFRPQISGSQSAAVSLTASCEAAPYSVALTGLGDSGGVSEFPDPHYDSIWVPRTTAHEAAGVAVGQSITPGAIGVVIGQSITLDTAGTLLTRTDLFPTDFTFLNLARVGADVTVWANNPGPWSGGVNDIVAAGHAVSDVEVAWVSLVYTGDGDNVRNQKYYDRMNTVLDLIPVHFPQIKMIYVSTGFFGGFSVKDFEGLQKNSEPLRWSNALVVDRIVAEREGSAVWVGWGPYTWASDQPRADGLAWTLDMFKWDGIHHTTTGGGRELESQLIYDFFVNDTTSPWYSVPSP